jgi:phage tail tape-measure protein
LPLLAAAFLALSGLTACDSMNRQQQRALSGGAIGAAGGAALGAGVGAVTGGLSVPVGALIGAAVGGLAGAVWADSNNDGCVDGYIRNGQYYSGGPVVQPTSSSSYTGERG